jgi:hypothetical protein
MVIQYRIFFFDIPVLPAWIEMAEPVLINKFIHGADCALVVVGSGECALHRNICVGGPL